MVTLAASDPDGDAVRFFFSGGSDRTLFAITGGHELVFTAPPDFEAPADANRDNIYQVQITANDGVGGSSRQTVTVNVADIESRELGCAGGTELFRVLVCQVGG